MGSAVEEGASEFARVRAFHAAIPSVGGRSGPGHRGPGTGDHMPIVRRTELLSGLGGHRQHVPLRSPDAGAPARTARRNGTADWSMRRVLVVCGSTGTTVGGRAHRPRLGTAKPVELLERIEVRQRGEFSTSRPVGEESNHLESQGRRNVPPCGTRSIRPTTGLRTSTKSSGSLAERRTAKHRISAFGKAMASRLAAASSVAPRVITPSTKTRRVGMSPPETTRRLSNCSSTEG